MMAHVHPRHHHPSWTREGERTKKGWHNRPFSLTSHSIPSSHYWSFIKNTLLVFFLWMRRANPLFTALPKWSRRKQKSLSPPDTQTLRKRGSHMASDGSPWCSVRPFSLLFFSFLFHVFKRGTHSRRQQGLTSSFSYINFKWVGKTECQ